LNYSGKIIVLAYPDTFVKMSDELFVRLLPIVGLGTRTHIKAGHAALILIENKTGHAAYFDFGRYITREGLGRVRGANTDVELKIPFNAVIENDKLQNLDQFLLWLDANPDKTHGSGRLVASLCEAIDYRKVKGYIDELQAKESFPYKAFGKVGESCNCSRFVTDAILKATEDKAIIKELLWNKKFTPSTVGNVEKSASELGVFEVHQGVIKQYTSSAFKENMTNYFDHRVPVHMKNPKALTGDKLPKEAQLLKGIGSSAWFHYVKRTPQGLLISRYNEQQDIDFQGIFGIPEGFDPEASFSFDYDCNCLYCHVIQKDIRYKMELVKEAQITTSSSQRVHSA